MTRNMKNSGVMWIGDIPFNWNIVPFRSYVVERSEKNKGEKTRELLALSFALGVTLYKDKIYNMDRVKENYEDYQLVYKDDLVLSPNDIIKGSIYVSKYNGCISPMYSVFSARNSQTHYLPYLSYLLRTKEAGRKFFFIARGLIGEILENGKYVTRRKSVSRQDLMSFKVLLPPIEEQRAIVDFLNDKCRDIDGLLSDLEKEIRILTEYKKSIIVEKITGGLNPDAPLTQSDIPWIGNIPSHWTCQRLKYSLSANDGGVWGEDPQEDGNTIVLRSTEQTIDGKWDIQEPAQRYLKNVSNYRSCICREGDLLVTKSSGSKAHIGKTNLVTKEIADMECCYSNFLQRLHLINGRYEKYFWYILNSNVTRLQFSYRQNDTSGIGNINSTDIDNIWVPIPPFNEQKEIAEFLDEKCGVLDESIAAKQAQIEKLKAYKVSLIYEYVTGKKQVAL